MKSLIATICILGLVGMVVGAAVMAQNTVTATVTPQVIAVEVTTDGSVDYGILDASESNNTFDGTLPALGDQQTITNVGNASADIALRSSDAEVTPGSNITDWALAGVAAGDAFVHSYDIDVGVGPAVWAAFPATGTFDNENTATVATLANPGNTATLDLEIDMPTDITNLVPHSMTVTVVATATP